VKTTETAKSQSAAAARGGADSCLALAHLDVKEKSLLMTTRPETGQTDNMARVLSSTPKGEIEEKSVCANVCLSLSSLGPVAAREQGHIYFLYGKNVYRSTY